MAVECSTTLARQSGTHCQMNLEIWTVLIILVTSSLEVFSNEMCYINLRFAYLLTYFTLIYGNVCSSCVGCGEAADYYDAEEK